MIKKKLHKLACYICLRKQFTCFIMWLILFPMVKWILDWEKWYFSAYEWYSVSGLTLLSGISFTTGIEIKIKGFHMFTWFLGKHFCMKFLLLRLLPKTNDIFPAADFFCDILSYCILFFFLSLQKGKTWFTNIKSI